MRLLLFISMVVFAGCKSTTSFDVNKELRYCITQADKTNKSLQDSSLIPRSIANGKTDWRKVNYHDWTCGFYPGILWYNYEYSKDEKWKKEATRFS